MNQRRMRSSICSTYRARYRTQNTTSARQPTWINGSRSTAPRTAQICCLQHDKPGLAGSLCACGTVGENLRSGSSNIAAHATARSVHRQNAGERNAR